MSERDELAAKLKSEGEKVFAFFSSLSEAQWKAEVYTEGETWTTREVLAHFVFSERGLLRLFEQIRQGGAGADKDFSIDRYNAAQQQKIKETPAAELLTQYRQMRAESVAWVSGLNEAELDLAGRHPFLGETSLREMIKMLYLHNQLHLRDVKKAI